MTKRQKEIYEEMDKLIAYWDIETAHQKADDLLCEMLTILGHKDLITLYREVEKWYA
jgi:hypothetical protein